MYIYGGYDSNIGLLSDFYRIELKGVHFYAWIPVNESIDDSIDS
jgi:hypothetical protein